jgi:hypothetical protein
MADEKVAAPVAEKKKVKKLAKVIEGNVLTIKEAITNTTLVFDAGKLPEAIQKNLMPYGLSQKLGDAAAGREGQDAVDAIKKVWEGLMKGDWSTRAPAAEKVSKKSILDKFNAMPEGPEKKAARNILQSLGLLEAAK